MEAIGLNPIRLDAIGIDPIRLNAIRLGVPGASSGSNRPYIDPDVLASLVAVCICDGKSNNDPDRAIIKNLVDPDNPFVVSNAAYTKGSGYADKDSPYYGALVTDGVDDLITSTKTVQEMLGGSTEVTVVSMIHQIELNSTHGKAFTNCIVATNSTTSYVRSQSNAAGKTGIYGYTYNSATQLLINNILGDKNDYEKLLADASNVLSDSEFYVASSKASTNTFSKVAWYWTFISKKSLTSDQINQVIAYYNLDKYVKPDIYYDVKKQGLSNNTPDADWYLKDFSGNGRDMQLYNFAKKLGSGIGKYNEDFKTWYQITNGTAIISHDKLRVNKVSDINGGNFIAWKQNDIKAFKARITGVPKDTNILYLYSREGSARESIAIDTDGEYDLPYSHSYTSGVGFAINSNFPREIYIGVTIEQIPDYEGALVTDAVTDYGKAENLPIYKDYTVVADREIVDGLINNADGGVATRGTHYDLGAFCFDYKDGVYSFGATNGYADRVKPNRFISYMSKYIHNGITTPVGDAVDNNPLCIAKLGSSIDRYSKLALWSFLLFPYSLSEFLLERQLKRYKLGTLHPDMVEVRPIINSTGKYFRIEYRNGQGGLIQPGSYLPVGSILRISVVLNNNWDEVSSLIVNGVDIPKSSYSNNNFWIYDATVTKSPQKIDITIDEYIRYEDIVQPYPYIVKIRNNDGYIYTYGDKLKVGSEIIRGKVINLLPELYSVANGIFLNGQQITNSEATVVVSKNMVFSHGGNTYLKANEPNCIADPQRLSIPNSSYKILGYIPDISGHGNHLKINNSAYAGMSGANGYVENFTTWGVYSGIILTDSTIKTNSDFKPANSWVGYKGANTRLNSFSVNITGIPKEGILSFRVNADTYIELSNGRNDLSFDDLLISVSSGFRITKGSNLDWSNLVIQQIGEYEGSFRLDGVEDFITIPTLASGAKQVLMKVNTQNMNGVLYDQRKSSGSPWYFAVYNTTEADSVAYAARNTNGKTYIDGVLNANITCQQLLNITHNLTVTNNGANEQNTQSPVIGASRSAAANFSKMALFTFMSFDEISSEDEIKELNDIVGIEGGYVESPDYYFDSFGKSNVLADDIDFKELGLNNTRSMILDKSIEGLEAIEHYKNTGSVVNLALRRLSLNNFAFNEESGFGGWLGINPSSTNFNYAGNSTINNWSRGGTFVKGLNRNSGPGCGYALAKWFDDVNHILKFKVKITGLTDTDELYICQYNISPTLGQKLSNGINEVTLDLSASIEPTYRYVSFRYPPLTNDVDFEFLYEYQNGLVSDGVEDNLKNTSMPVLTDYTWIMKRKRLNDKSSTTLCYKGAGGTNGAFLFEFIEGGNGTRNFGNTNAGITFPDLISWQTKSSYNGKDITVGSATDGNALHIFMGSNSYPYYTKAVFYKAMLYSKTIDQLSINMLKNLFAKDELIDVNNPIFKKEEL